MLTTFCSPGSGKAACIRWLMFTRAETAAEPLQRPTAEERSYLQHRRKEQATTTARRCLVFLAFVRPQVSRSVCTSKTLLLVRRPVLTQTPGGPKPCTSPSAPAPLVNSYARSLDGRRGRSCDTNHKTEMKTGRKRGCLSSSATRVLWRHAGVSQAPTKTCFGAKADRPQRGEDQEELEALATSSHNTRTCLEPEARRLTSQRVLKGHLHPSLNRFFPGNTLLLR